MANICSDSSFARVHWHDWRHRTVSAVSLIAIDIVEMEKRIGSAMLHERDIVGYEIVQAINE